MYILEYTAEYSTRMTGKYFADSLESFSNEEDAKEKAAQLAAKGYTSTLYKAVKKFSPVKPSVQMEEISL